MTKITRWIVPACLTLGLAVAAGPQAAAQDETYNLRFNHVLSPKHPFHAGFEKWAERVEERTDGGLQMTIYHSSQLGVEEDIIEQMRQGANIGQNTDAARMGNYVEEISVVNGPYFVETLEDAYALADSPSMQKWQQTLADDYGLKVVCFDWVQGFRHFFTNKPVRKPEDLDGLRIRTPPAPIWQQSIDALGAEATAMNFGDVYSGLQQRAIDGAELVYPNITAANLNEVLDYANETGHILLINFQVVSADWFNGLPDSYQTALVEECRAAGQETSEVLQTASQEAKAELKEAGMTIVEDVDKDAFRKAGEAAYEALGVVDAKNKVQAEISD